MKFKFFVALFFVCTFFYATDSISAEKESIKSPSTFLSRDKYEFAPVPEGFEIKHDFIIENKGNAVLNIKKVRTG
ncbi:MAG: hypothetical protein JRI88_05990 [Deltaproteobacteria bacterium]|nr:hypothetical protein [Deltaproteobacteria bacterium]